MSTTPDTKQDHPGPEWVSVNDMWWHPGLDYHAETVEEARAISAAALEWEFQRSRAFADGMTASGNFTHLMRGIGQ